MDCVPNDFVFDLDGRVLNDIVDFVNHALEKASSVLIHCYDGLSISPAVVIAYMMNEYSWGVDKAYEFLLQKRPDIQLEQEYIDQLYALEQQIIDRTDDTGEARRKRNEWDLETTAG